VASIRNRELFQFSSALLNRQKTRSIVCVGLGPVPQMQWQYDQCASNSITPPKISATTMDAITALAIGARIMREFVRAGAPNFN
jgi:hypothetical protein